ncbi:MAG: type 3 domain protein [Moraxellaceae bacterium]|nr:type 3 domain protein [Moraxellaceae bacterium]
MTMFQLRRMLLASALALPAIVAQAADPGTLTRAEPLREKPFADAKILVNAASGAKVEILLRNGGWYQVKSGTRTGWVRMLSVRRTTAPAGSSITGLAGVASGRTGTGTVTTTTGVRGLDAEKLTAAKFDEAQVAKAETYRTSRKDAAAFAAQEKLAVRDVKPLPAPVKK